MPGVLTDIARPVASIGPGEILALGDDECLLRLARAVAEHDSGHVDEVARLIGRLARPVE